MALQSVFIQTVRESTVGNQCYIFIKPIMTRKMYKQPGGKTYTLRDCKAHQPITVGEPYLNVDWIFNDTEELLLTFLICDQLFKRPNFLEQGF